MHGGAGRHGPCAGRGGRGNLAVDLPEVLRSIVVPLQETLFGEVVIDPDGIRMLLFGVAMVAIMIFRPEGLWPSQVRKRELNRGKEQPA